MVAPRISREEVLARKDDTDTVVIDVRKKQNEADLKIEGAILHNPEGVSAWAENYNEEQIIFLYCS